MPQKPIHFIEHFSPPVRTKPFINVNIEWENGSDSSFTVLKKYFRNSLVDDITQAVAQIFGTEAATVVDDVEMAISGGYAAEKPEKTIFVFFKGYGSESEIHIQGFETVRNLIRDKEWLMRHLNKAKTKHKIVNESMRPGKSTFRPRSVISFFKKDLLAFLSSSILLFVAASLDLLINGKLTQSGLISLYSSIAAFVLWAIVSGAAYLLKRKTYVLELPVD